MAKKYIIYVGGKDLSTAPVTQNEIGKYYRNSAGVYYKPTLAEFDNAKPPAGYSTYIGGSHAGYINNAQRNPIDFSLVAGTVITMNVDIKILSSTLADGSWVKVQIVGTDIMLAFVHTYRWANINTVVKAGNQICQVAPQSVTGFPPHLHADDWSGKGRKVRELILKGDYTMGSFKKGDKVIITDTQNIRQAPAGKVTGSSIIGQTGTIYDNPRNAVADGVNYTWWDIHFDGAGSGWLADVGKFKLYTAPEPKPPQEPEKPVEPSECQKQVESLKEQLKGLESKLGACESKRKLLEAEKGDLGKEIKRLDTELEQMVEDIKELMDKNELLEGENKRLVLDREELVTEISKLKENCNKNTTEKIVDWLRNILTKIVGGE